MKKKPLFWIAVAFLAVAGAGLLAYAAGDTQPAMQVASGGAAAGDAGLPEPGTPVDGAPATTATETAPAVVTELPEPAPQQSASSAVSAVIDVDAAMADRALGDPSAPVKIYEYASLTCSHCADFATKTFDQVKSEYIDTGKVYFVYHDFPLNAPALDAAAVARCLPAERYYSFIKYLFESQDKWAATADYKNLLRQNAKLVGMTDARFDACVGSEKLKAALVDKLQKANEKYKIESTPTFIFNDGAEKISGARSFDSFRKTIDKLLAEKAKAE